LAALVIFRTTAAARRTTLQIEPRMPGVQRLFFGFDPFLFDQEVLAGFDPQWPVLNDLVAGFDS